MLLTALFNTRFLSRLCTRWFAYAYQRKLTALFTTVCASATLLAPSAFLPANAQYFNTPATTNASEELPYEVLKKSLINLHREYKQLQQQYATLQQNHNQLTLQLNQQSHSGNQANTEILQQQLSQSLSLNNQLRVEMDALQQQLQAAQRNIQSIPQPTNNNMAVELDLVKSRNQDLLAEVREVKTKLNDAVFRQAELEQALQKAQAAPSVSPEEKVQFELVRARYQDLLTENQGLKAQLTQHETALEGEQKKRIAELETELASSRQELKETFEKLNDQNRRIALIQDKMKQLASTQTTSTQEQVTTLNQQLTEKSAKIEVLEDQLQTLQAQLKSKGNGATVVSHPATGDVAELKRQLAQVQSELATKTDALNQIQQSTSSGAASDGDEVKRLRLELAQAIAGLNQKNREIEALKNEKAPPVDLSVQAALEQKNKELAQTIEQMNAQLTSADQAIEALKRQTASSSNHDTAIKLLEEKVANRDQAIQTLEAKLAAANDKLSRATTASPQSTSSDKTKPLEARIEFLEKALNDASTKADEKTKALALAETRLQQLNKDLEKQKTLLAQKPDSSNKISGSTVRDLEQQLSTTKSELSRKTAEVATLQSQLQDLSNKATSPNQPDPLLVATIEQQKNDIESLKTKLSEKEMENTRLISLNQTGKTTPSNNAPANGEFLSLQQEQKARQMMEQGLALEKAQNLTEATNILAKAVQLNPFDPKIVTAFSRVAILNKDNIKLKTILEDILEKNPTQDAAANALGKLYLLNNQPDLAQATFSAGIPVALITNYATSLKYLNRNEEAERALKVALDIHPNDPEILFNLGNLYSASEQLAAARDAYLKAIQFNPRFAQAYYNIGLVYYRLSEKKRAAEMLSKFLELDPTTPVREKIESYIEQIRLETGS